MFRRSLVLVVVGVLACAVASSAFAVRVHVRIEGRTTTIFGAAEPTLSVAASALDALNAASLRGEFYYHLAQSSFGQYVDQIGRYPAAGNSGWVFKVNGASPPVGASAVRLKDGDRVLWYWAAFGPAGGPPTLDIETYATKKACRRGSVPRGFLCNPACFQAYAVDDRGRRTRARDVVFILDGRRIRARAGVHCTRRVWSAVRATKRGAVRSQMLVRGSR